MPEPRSVHIIGAGVTGLTCAYMLEQHAAAHCVQLRISISERSDRTGGKIATHTIPTAHGPLRIEAAADAMLHTKPWAIDLARELGLAAECITTNAERRLLTLWDGKRRITFPPGMHLLVPRDIRAFLRSPLLSLPGKIRNLCEPWFPARQSHDDESLADFVRRRFGHETLDILATTLMAGIYSTDPEHLSMQAAFPQFVALERTHGHISPAIRASAAPTATSSTSPFTSFRTGMQTFVDTLADAIRTPIALGTTVHSLNATTDGIQLELSTGRATSDAVVLCLPAAAAAAITQRYHPETSNRLRQFRTRDSGSITLVYHAAPALDAFPGYGVLIPRTAQRPFSAITLSAVKFTDRAPAPFHLVRLFFGPGELFDGPDEYIEAAACDLIRVVFGHDVPPDSTHITRWPSGAPQYDVHHRDRVAAVRAAAPAGVFFAGSPFDGVGIPDCVHSAQQTATAVIETLWKGEKP